MLYDWTISNGWMTSESKVDVCKRTMSTCERYENSESKWSKVESACENTVNSLGAHWQYKTSANENGKVERFRECKIIRSISNFTDHTKLTPEQTQTKAQIYFWGVPVLGVYLGSFFKICILSRFTLGLLGLAFGVLLTYWSVKQTCLLSN